MENSLGGLSVRFFLSAVIQWYEGCTQSRTTGDQMSIRDDVS